MLYIIAAAPICQEKNRDRDYFSVRKVVSVPIFILFYQPLLRCEKADLKRMHKKYKEQLAVTDCADAPFYLTKKLLFLLPAVMLFYHMYIWLRPRNIGVRDLFYHAHKVPVNHAAHTFPVYDLRAGDDLAPLVIRS